jgi:hypothetical protein
VRAEAMAALISASIAPVLAPLVAQLDAHRQTIERQGDQLVSQAETIGRQTAELERAAATVVTLTDELEAERAARSTPEARTAPQAGDALREPVVRRWRMWSPWLLAALAIGAVVVLLSWLR